MLAEKSENGKWLDNVSLKMKMSEVGGEVSDPVALRLVLVVEVIAVLAYDNFAAYYPKSNAEMNNLGALLALARIAESLMA